MRHFRMPRLGTHAGDQRSIQTQRQLIRKARRLSQRHTETDGLERECFELSKQKATAKVCEFKRQFPRKQHWTRVESWKELSNGKISFTLCRLPSAI